MLVCKTSGRLSCVLVHGSHRIIQSTSWSERVASSQFSVPGLCGRRSAASGHPALAEADNTPEVRNKTRHSATFARSAAVLCLGHLLRWLALTDRS